MKVIQIAVAETVDTHPTLVVLTDDGKIFICYISPKDAEQPIWKELKAPQ